MFSASGAAVRRVYPTITNSGLIVPLPQSARPEFKQGLPYRLCKEEALFKYMDNMAVRLEIKASLTDIAKRTARPRELI